jgi:GNAT superfamily N-acetyltransferase
MDYSEERRRVQDAHAQLVARGVLEPLSEASNDVRVWSDCELASMVENRFFVTLDPRTLTPEERERWTPRATSRNEHIVNPHEHAWYTTPYWITEGGERVGTVGLATSTMGGSLVMVSSFYVFPTLRGRGIGGRFMRRAYEAVRAHGFHGLRVPTHWTWTAAVRFYMNLGLWVRDWKHSLVLTLRDDLPPHRIEIGEQEASFGILEDGKVTRLITAARKGDRLRWDESPRYRELSRESHEIRLNAPGTFALGLALAGFPLIRSDKLWARRHDWSDFGEPEGLAHKIEIFEALDRRDGFDVRTARIPGILYRDFDDID